MKNSSYVVEDGYMKFSVSNVTRGRISSFHCNTYSLLSNGTGIFDRALESSMSFPANDDVDCSTAGFSVDWREVSEHVTCTAFTHSSWTDTCHKWSNNRRFTCQGLTLNRRIFQNGRTWTESDVLQCFLALFRLWTPKYLQTFGLSYVCPGVMMQTFRTARSQ